MERGDSFHNNSIGEGMKFKRVLACGDMHCGHRTGLTHPKYQTGNRGDKYKNIREECWDFWQDGVESLKPIDILIHNGDAVDGKAYRSGGTELTHPDRGSQVDMAVKNIEIAEPSHVVMTHGTPYHTGAIDDWESVVADRLSDRGTDTSISGQEWIDVNGITFDIKHKVGSSTIPHGRATAIKKEQLWNLIWADVGEQPKANIVLRNHVHFFDYTGNATYLAVVLPALQGQGTKFGSRQCSGIVDFGFVWFDIYEDGSYTWSWKVLRAESQRQKARVL